MPWLHVSNRPFSLWSNKRRRPEEKDNAPDAESDSARFLLDENAYHRYQRPQRNRRAIFLWSLALTACVLFLLDLGLHLRTSPRILDHSALSSNKYEDCGSSIEEARQKGCRFDIMSFAWQPPACYHSELIESFNARTEWHFYSNESLHPSEELPLDRVMAGDYRVVYAPKKYHPIHCTYMWQKLHKAYQEQLPIDDSTIPMGHTLHCEKVLLIDYTGEASCKGHLGCPTRLCAAFSKCGYL